MTREQLTEYLAAQVQPGVPFVLVLEGRSAAGKTTLAGMLAERFHGSVVHTDDFFLPGQTLPGSAASPAVIWIWNALPGK